jgi:hypothetical protein
VKRHGAPIVEWLALPIPGSSRSEKSLARKGYRVGTVRVKAAVGSFEGRDRYNVSYGFVRLDGGFDPDAEIVERGV